MTNGYPPQPKPCIWYVSKYVILPSGEGPASRGYGLMREFSRMGYRSVIVTSDSMGKFGAPPAEEPVAFEQLPENVQLCRFRTLKYSDSKSLRRLLSWADFELKLLKLRRNSLPAPDALIVSSLSLLTILNGLRLRRRYRCRLIFEVRDIWPLSLVHLGGVSRRHPLVIALGVVERIGYRHADAIVGTMPNLAEHVHQVTKRQLPVTCIPMGVDTAAIETTASLPDEYISANLPAAKFTVAYAGSVGIANALDILFRLAESTADTSDIHYVVLGDGELLKQYVSRYGSLSNLTFAPRLPRAQVQEFLERCDLLYISVSDSPIYRYGISPNKLIDYMLAAKPIVASYSGYPSMINEADCGVFVPSGDLVALRDAVFRFRSMSPEERKVIGCRGRDWVLKNRSFSVLANNYLDVLLPDRERQAV